MNLYEGDQSTAPSLQVVLSPLIPFTPFPFSSITQLEIKIYQQQKSKMSPSDLVWSREEEKAFENAIAMHWTHEDDSTNETWETIASCVPSKCIDEIKQHYQLLVDDVADIEAGVVPLPKYVGEESSSSTKESSFGCSGKVDRQSNCGYANGFSGKTHESIGHSRKGSSSSRSEQERRKGIPWTEEEHKLFLAGLDKYGKGDWRSISRNFVISRTPTQVASHAQKYFIRINSSQNRDRRRSSIHDITSINNNGDVSSTHQPPIITGQQQPNSNPSNNPPALGGCPSVVNHRNNQPNMHNLGMYSGAPMGHPVAAPPSHMAAAVGTPVMLPPGHHHHPYVLPVAYPMPPQQPPMHH